MSKRAFTSNTGVGTTAKTTLTSSSSFSPNTPPSSKSSSSSSKNEMSCLESHVSDMHVGSNLIESVDHFKRYCDALEIDPHMRIIFEVAYHAVRLSELLVCLKKKHSPLVKEYTHHYKKQTGLASEFIQSDVNNPYNLAKFLKETQEIENEKMRLEKLMIECRDTIITMYVVLNMLQSVVVTYEARTGTKRMGKNGSFGLESSGASPSKKKRVVEKKAKLTPTTEREEQRQEQQREEEKSPLDEWRHIHTDQMKALCKIVSKGLGIPTHYEGEEAYLHGENYICAFNCCVILGRLGHISTTLRLLKPTKKDLMIPYYFETLQDFKNKDVATLVAFISGLSSDGVCLAPNFFDCYGPELKRKLQLDWLICSSRFTMGRVMHFETFSYVVNEHRHEKDKRREQQKKRNKLAGNVASHMGLSSPQASRVTLASNTHNIQRSFQSLHDRGNSGHNRGDNIDSNGSNGIPFIKQEGCPSSLPPRVYSDTSLADYKHSTRDLNERAPNENPFTTLQRPQEAQPYPPVFNAMSPVDSIVATASAAFHASVHLYEQRREKEDLEEAYEEMCSSLDFTKKVCSGSTKLKDVSFVEELVFYFDYMQLSLEEKRDENLQLSWTRDQTLLLKHAQKRYWEIFNSTESEGTIRKIVYGDKKLRALKRAFWKRHQIENTESYIDPSQLSVPHEGGSGGGEVEMTESDTRGETTSNEPSFIKGLPIQEVRNETTFKKNLQKQVERYKEMNQTISEYKWSFGVLNDRYDSASADSINGEEGRRNCSPETQPTNNASTPQQKQQHQQLQEEEYEGFYQVVFPDLEDFCTRSTDNIKGNEPDNEGEEGEDDWHANRNNVVTGFPLTSHYDSSNYSTRITTEPFEHEIGVGDEEAFDIGTSPIFSEIVAS